MLADDPTDLRLRGCRPDIVWVDTMPDRQRFLAIAPERMSTGSVTIVQNWRAALLDKR